jgi:hypothetical protein
VKQKLWYGWVRDGAVVSGTDYGRVSIGRSGVATKCVNDDWKTVAAHEVTDRDNRIYSTVTDEYAYVGNC